MRAHGLSRSHQPRETWLTRAADTSKRRIYTRTALCARAPRVNLENAPDCCYGNEEHPPFSNCGLISRDTPREMRCRAAIISRIITTGSPARKTTTRASFILLALWLLYIYLLIYATVKIITHEHAVLFLHNYAFKTLVSSI